MTGWPDCAFFVVIFYVISPTIAQFIAGPRSRRGAALMPYGGPFLYETQSQA